MSLETGNNGVGTTMLLGPASVGGGMPYPVYMNGQGGGNGNGNGMFGQDAWWIVLLVIILFAVGGNWGGNNGGGGNGFAGSGTPIIVNDGNGGSVQRGFDQAAVMGGLNGIQSGVQNLSTQLCNCCGDISTQLCNGFSGVNASISGAQNALAQQMYGNTIADLERSYANQTAITQGLNNIQSQFANCCCENRLQSESLRATILSENCADRAAVSDGIRDLLTAQTASTQRILDKLCDQELQAERRENQDLRAQLQMANLAASQTAQTARLERSNGDVIEGLYNRLVQCPVPSMPVYGSQPIFTCPNNNNNGCGCGCNGGGFMN